MLQRRLSLAVRRLSWEDACFCCSRQPLVLAAEFSQSRRRLAGAVSASHNWPTSAPRRQGDNALLRNHVVFRRGVFRFRVKGASFHQEIVRTLNEGVEVWLQPQPDNLADAEAIAVHCAQGIVGYVPRHSTRSVRQALQASGVNMNHAQGRVEAVLLWDGPTGLLVEFSLARQESTDRRFSAVPSQASQQPARSAVVRPAGEQHSETSSSGSCAGSIGSSSKGSSGGKGLYAAAPSPPASQAPAARDSGLQAQIREQERSLQKHPALAKMLKADLVVECRERGIAVEGTVKQLRELLKVERAKQGE